MSTAVRMPPLDGASAWLNTDGPLRAEDLRGRVVLVDFWTLTCINWLRTAPHVRAWARAYRDDGLVVVGVHTPEFSFEHGPDAVRRAVRERGIEHPVAVDDDYAIWDAFANRYWPALYFVDRDGAIRDEHPGEGRYAESEQVLQELLGVRREPVVVRGEGVEAEADWAHLRSPETYLGHGRGERFASPGPVVVDAPHVFALPDRLTATTWALAGGWTIAAECSRVVDTAGGSLAVRFHARDAHLVLARSSPDPVPFRVRLDGEAPGASAGVDVDPEGNGVLDQGRMYGLVRQHDRVRDRTLEVTFLAPGAEAYAVTFG